MKSEESESINEFERSVCADCVHNCGLACPANGKGGVRVKCEEKGNVNPKLFCSSKE